MILLEMWKEEMEDQAEWMGKLVLTVLSREAGAAVH